MWRLRRIYRVEAGIFTYESLTIELNRAENAVRDGEKAGRDLLPDPLTEVHITDGRQDDAGPPTLPSGGEDPQPYREEHEKHDAQPERGHRLTQYGEDPCRVIRAAAPVSSGEHAQRKTDGYGKKESRAGQHQGIGKPFSQELGHGYLARG